MEDNIFNDLETSSVAIAWARYVTHIADTFWKMDKTGETYHSYRDRMLAEYGIISIGTDNKKIMIPNDEDKAAFILKWS
jgi:hypothetical protein